MTGTGLRDDTTLGAIRLDWWAASDWNGARNTFGIPGRLRRNPHRIRVASKAELKQRILAYLNDINREPVVHTWSYRITLPA